MRKQGPRPGVSRRCRPLLTLGLAVLLLAACAGCERAKPKYPEARARGGFVTIELAGIEPGSGRFQTYRTDAGKLVDFLVYRESTGTPRAVLDACKTCFRWKMGYAIDGTEVVCLKCDMRFKLDGLAAGSGSCVPISVKTEQRGEKLVIAAAELEAGARFF